MTSQSRIRDEQGMTIVEVVVAAFVLIAGALAVLNLVDTANRTTYRAEQSQVVNSQLQDELERIKQLPFDQIALTGPPGTSAQQSDPDWRVQGTGFAVNRDGTDPKPLVYDGGALEGGGAVSGGALSPASTPYENEDVSGTIHRYVVWEDDPSCPESDCPGSQDFKRVVVAATLNDTASGGTRAYQELQARIADPQAEPVDNPNPIPPGGDDPTPWTFFLTDTTCNHSTRQPIPGSHPTHNTRGVCGSGLKTGTTPGAPDLMFTEAPPLEDEQPLHDYATDVEPAVNPEADRGLTIKREGSNGCLGTAVLDILNLGDILAILGDNDRYQKVHKWLSPPIPNGFDIQLNGEGTLNLWTKTVNGASYPGRLCIWLFVRQLGLLGIPVDTPAVNLTPPLLNLTYFRYEQSQWPTTWTEISVPLNFLLNAHLLPGTRLGIAVAVERSGTGSDGLEFMYDAPSFDSRLSVTSDSLLP